MAGLGLFIYLFLAEVLPLKGEVLSLSTRGWSWDAEGSPWDGEAGLYGGHWEDQERGAGAQSWVSKALLLPPEAAG